MVEERIVNSTTGGVKGSKLARFSLLPSRQLWRLAEHYGKGARKYSSSIEVTPPELERLLVGWCSCQNNTVQPNAIPTNDMPLEDCAYLATSHSTQKPDALPVTPTESLTLKSCVGSATTENLNNETPNMRRGRTRITKRGKRHTLNTPSNTITHMLEMNGCEPVTIKAIEKERWQVLGLLGRMKSKYLQHKVASVLFVGERQRDNMTSTTITTQCKLEDYCVANVTKDLDCSENLKRLLGQHSPTCKIHQHRKFCIANNSIRIDTSGDRNWELGYNWSLSYDAAQRHLNQFWGGEDIDEETGSLHLIAAAWHCIAMAEWFDTHPELDDRPGKGK